jgi:hypothetical protein
MINRELTAGSMIAPSPYGGGAVAFGLFFALPITRQPHSILPRWCAPRALRLDVNKTKPLFMYERCH